MKKKIALVGVVMGSDSDLPVLEEALSVLDDFAIPYEVTVSSAHRSPKRTSGYAQSAMDRGIEVIIAAAGGAAHLAGVIAAETLLPVIGVPVDSSPLKGLDALLSTVQMPGGVPVAAMAIGRSGARNAGIFAARILSIKYPEIRKKLLSFKIEMAAQVDKKAKALARKRR